MHLHVNRAENSMLSASQYCCCQRLSHELQDLNKRRRLALANKTQKLDIFRCVVGLMDDCVSVQNLCETRPIPNKQPAKQGHSSVPQLLHGNAVTLSHWSLRIALFGNDKFCCSSVNRISSINHIYRLVCPLLSIFPLMLLNDQCKHIYAWQNLFQK